MTTDPASASAGLDRELTLDWVQGVPNGLSAYAPLPVSGSYPRDSQGRPKFRRVRLRSTHNPTVPTRPADLLTDGDWTWITASPRQWASVAQRFGDSAYSLAVALATAGCVTIEHDLRLTHLVRPPRRLHPHPDLSSAHAQARDKRRDQTAAIRERAATLTDALADEWPDVSAALRSTTNPDRLFWAVAAASDLADGRSHDSVRAFVQVHAGHTKARDDVHHLLAELGFSPDALAALGLARNPYIGLGGPFRLQTPTGLVDLAGIPGPHDIRLPAGHDITLQLPSRAETLMVIENRQAAEAGCDAYPDLPIIWCHGQPPTAVLNLISQAASYANSIMICTDADLGGVNIAARIWGHLGPGHRCTVLDTGAVEHYAGKPFNTYSRTRLAALAARTDQIGQFAQACLARGYAVEQEAAARASLRASLKGPVTDRRVVARTREAAEPKLD